MRHAFGILLDINEPRHSGPQDLDRPSWMRNELKGDPGRNLKGDGKMVADVTEPSGRQGNIDRHDQNVVAGPFGPSDEIRQMVITLGNIELEPAMLWRDLGHALKRGICRGRQRVGY